MPANNTTPTHMFSAPIPGASLTKAPGSTPWQRPPKFTKLSDACDFIFNQITQEPKLMQILQMFKHGVDVEMVSRVIIFSGFSQGYWSADMSMLLSRPVVYMLAGVAQRAGLNPKLTHIDRSGMKNLVNFKKIVMTSSGLQAPKADTKPPTEPKGMGLMSPLGE